MMISDPPVRRGPDGEPRHVQVCLAFVGLDPQDAAERTRARFGGNVKGDRPGALQVRETRLGNFTARCDPRPAASRPGEQAPQTGALTRETSLSLADFVTAGRDGAVPVEIDCPPVPYRQLGEIECLLDELRRAGASQRPGGTSYAIGFELAPEAPSLDAADVTAVLRAFCLLCDWLRKDVTTETLSDVLPAPAPYPLRYRRRVADLDYAPDWERLAADYLEDNPTSDRELDLLPLIAAAAPGGGALDKRLGRAAPEPRPVYRYRLPRAIAERGGGRITDEWNRWVLVERLAADPDRLSDMARAFRGHQGEFLRGDWADESEQWLRA